jgi:hypothetical protein
MMREFFWDSLKAKPLNKKKLPHHNLFYVFERVHGNAPTRMSLKCAMVHAMSRPAVGRTQPPVQWVPGVKRGRGVTLTTHPHLVPRSWISRSYIFSPPYASLGVLWDCFFTVHTMTVAYNVCSVLTDMDVSNGSNITSVAQTTVVLATFRNDWVSFKHFWSRYKVYSGYCSHLNN